MDDMELLSSVKACDLFAHLTDEKIFSILPFFKKISLLESEVLFQQGTEPDGFYVLVSGKLVSSLETPTAGKKIIGMAYPGETIGELGVISGEPRSLTVSALTDSELWKLSAEAFFRITTENPDISSQIMQVITKRSLKTLKLIASTNKAKFLVFFKGNELIPIEQLKEFIQTQSAEKKIEFWDEESLSAEKVSRVIESSSYDDYIIVTLITNINALVFQLIEKQSLYFYLIIQNNLPITLTTQIQQILNYARKNNIRVELIILRDNFQPTELSTEKWLNLADFWFYHNLNIHDTTSLQRFWRFILGKPNALVLGGGGVRGYCHFGVIKALLEHNIPIDIIGGTSVGAIVGGLYAFTLDYAKALEIFSQGTDLIASTVSFKNITLPLVSIFSGNPLNDFNREIFGSTRIENLSLPFFCVSANLSSKSEYMHKSGLLWQAVRSSSSIPGLWPPVLLNGDVHFDGGLLNQLPVDAMRALLGPNAKIIASQASVTKQDYIYYNFPSTISLKEALLYKLGFKKNQYNYPPFLEIFLSAIFLGASHVEEKNSALCDIHIKPDLTDFGRFKLNPGQAEQLINIGYEYTNKFLQNKEELFSKNHQGLFTIR